MVVVLFYVSWTTTVVSQSVERERKRGEGRKREREVSGGTLHSGRHVKNKVRITVQFCLLFVAAVMYNTFIVIKHNTLWH